VESHRLPTIEDRFRFLDVRIFFASFARNPHDGCDLRVPGHLTTSINRAIGLCATRHQRLQIGACLN
jgi:hypothetical protein